MLSSYQCGNPIRMKRAELNGHFRHIIRNINELGRMLPEGDEREELRKAWAICVSIRARIQQRMGLKQIDPIR